jgi:hypothetical protein
VKTKHEFLASNKMSASDLDFLTVMDGDEDWENFSPGGFHNQADDVEFSRY